MTSDTLAFPGEPPGPAREEVVVVARARDLRATPRLDRDTDAAGRDAEFAAFMSACSADLLRTAWLLCGDAHRAEELTQQALVRTHAAWPRVRTGDPLAYTRRILANLRVDTWRRRRREVLTAPEDLPDDASGPGGTGADGPDHPTRTADRDLLVRALATLSPRQRRIVVLRHLVGMPEAEVAADLGVSVGTVKSTTSRALATLRTTLAADPTSPAGPTGTLHPTRRTR
jgi:RNA polymerase sigma-70 factor (sigma-E family)